MVRIVLVLAVLLGLSGTAAAQAPQRKQKDEALHQYLIDEFAKVDAKLGQLDDKIAEQEAGRGQLKQQLADIVGELRTVQNMLKNSDVTLNALRAAHQDVLNLKTELAQVRQDLATLQDLVRKNLIVAAAAQAPVPAQAQGDPSDAPVGDGYITAVGNREVTINLGSKAGMKVGSRLMVYRSTDPKVQIGVVEVTEVLDANNSRAKIVSTSRPDIRFEFSDIVRPE